MQIRPGMSPLVADGHMHAWLIILAMDTMHAQCLGSAQHGTDLYRIGL